MLADPARATRAPAFDHARLAAALSAAVGGTFAAFRLPFNTIDFTADGQSILVAAGGRRWKCDVGGKQCAADTGPAPVTPGGRGGRGGAQRTVSTSPNRKSDAFIRNYNLWVRDVATGKETQLTTDGVKDFGYATDNAGWIRSDRPILLDGAGPG